MDIALLLVRLIIAAVLAIHALQKLLGWFDGPGLDKATAVFTALGQHPAKPMVILAATTELIAATLLAIGLLIPIGAAMGLSAMLVAGFSQTIKTRTIWNVAGGGEYPFILAAVAATTAFSGGKYSFDSLLGTPWTEDGTWVAVAAGCAGVALGIIAAIVPIARTRPPQIGD